MMLNFMQSLQDLSEDMKREREEELKTQRGGASLFFYDLSSMSGPTGLIYVAAIVAFFGIIFYVLIQKLLSKPIDFQKQKREEREEK